LFALGGAAAALAVVLLANATTYRTRQIPAEPAPAMALDTAAAAERLARALRFRTISFGGASGVDTTPFHDLQLYLQRTFPRLHAALTRERRHPAYRRPAAGPPPSWGRRPARSCGAGSRGGQPGSRRWPPPEGATPPGTHRARRPGGPLPGRPPRRRSESERRH